MNLLRGFKTSEFLLIILGFFFALAVAKGWLSAERVQYTASKVQQTTNEIPALIDAIKDLVKSLGPLAGYFALAWAYLKRKSEQKLATIESEREKDLVGAEIRKLQAETQRVMWEEKKERVRASLELARARGFPNAKECKK